MKPVRSVLFSLLLAGALCISCGRDTQEKAGDPRPRENGEAVEAVSVGGTLKETPDFTIMVPEGWEFLDLGDGAIQTRSRDGAHMVEARKSGSGLTADAVETAIREFVERKNGTPVETGEMKGLKFSMSSYEEEGTKRSVYYAMKDGARISITLVGPEHTSDPAVQAVFSSIVVK